jgi:hypothetical protein
VRTEEEMAKSKEEKGATTDEKPVVEEPRELTIMRPLLAESTGTHQQQKKKRRKEEKKKRRKEEKKKRRKEEKKKRRKEEKKKRRRES